MTPLFRKFLGMHWILFVAMAMLLACGVYSIYAAVHFRDGDQFYLTHMWREQINWILIGTVAYFATALIDYKWVRWAALFLYIGGVGLVSIVALVPRFGVEVHGQMIALKLPGIPQFQPAQPAIASTILLIAVVLGEAHKLFPWMRHYLVRFVVSAIIFAIPFLMMLKNGDLGSAMVIGPVALVMLIVGNIPFRCLIAAALVALSVIPFVYFFGLKEHQRARIDVTINLLQGKQVNTQNEGWALNNLLIAVGSAGWEGKGMDPRQLPANMKCLLQLGLLPNDTMHDDFIYAVVGETFGFRGGALLIALFLFLLVMCLTVAFFARDALGRLIVTGIIALLFAHVFEHVGMNIGILPITGIPLPFISYGGTFLIIVMSLMGLMQSVWVHRNKMLEEEAARRPALTPRTAPRDQL